MNFATYIFGILSAVLVLVVVIELLRQRRLRERHAIWWIVAGILALVAGIFPETLAFASKVVGVEVPTNLVFFVSIAILFLVCLQSSAELTALESKTRVLAERIALLELQGKRTVAPTGTQDQQRGVTEDSPQSDPANRTVTVSERSVP